MARRFQPAAVRVLTDALLVRRVAFGEADLMVTLFTEVRGTVSAVARSARRSAKRFPALEPMHLLRVGLEERPGADAGTLLEAAILRPRLVLTGDLARLEAAGRALRWVRQAAPPHTPEPAVWEEVNRLLDGLDDRDPAVWPEGRLAAMGLRLLVAMGWGLELERCVRCGRGCDPEGAGGADPERGGLVCRACGGGRVLLRASLRARILRATSGDDAALLPEDLRAAMELVDGALAAHAGAG
jgi:DNA repair protein RecO (recombination protein O)